MLCHIYNDLVGDASVASAMYFEAVRKLGVLAGQGSRAAFGRARSECDVCRDDCTRARTAITNHTADHGCRDATGESR